MSLYLSLLLGVLASPIGTVTDLCCYHVCVCVCVFDVAIRTKTRLRGVEYLNMLCYPLGYRSFICRFMSLSMLNRTGEFTFKRFPDFGPALSNHPTYVIHYLPRTHALCVAQYPWGIVSYAYRRNSRRRRN